MSDIFGSKLRGWKFFRGFSEENELFKSFEKTGSERDRTKFSWSSFGNEVY